MPPRGFRRRAAGLYVAATIGASRQHRLASYSPHASIGAAADRVIINYRAVLFEFTDILFIRELIYFRLPPPYGEPPLRQFV